MRNVQQVARQSTDDGREQVGHRGARQRGRSDKARALRQERHPRPESVQRSLDVRAEHDGSDGVEPVGRGQCWRAGYRRRPVGLRFVRPRRRRVGFFLLRVRFRHRPDDVGHLLLGSSHGTLRHRQPDPSQAFRHLDRVPRFRLGLAARDLLALYKLRDALGHQRLDLLLGHRHHLLLPRDLIALHPERSHGVPLPSAPPLRPHLEEREARRHRGVHGGALHLVRFGSSLHGSVPDPRAQEPEHNRPLEHLVRQPGDARDEAVLPRGHAPARVAQRLLALVFRERAAVLRELMSITRLFTYVSSFGNLVQGVVGEIPAGNHDERVEEGDGRGEHRAVG
mmetsp:Transcript_7448/g.33952  ORF Transcript_7448/g.33952 Transcript_7448/m.33952 type:complete len:338 (-) Transcript_7448:477-1490(-)